MIVMPSGADAEAPRAPHINAKGDRGFATGYFGTRVDGADPAIGAFHPAAYFVEVPAGFVSYPHFHVCDQFQVFAGGSGTLGKHALHDVVVHYTSAYTPYGPICAGEDGAAWFTLRNGWDARLHYMPESREELRASQRRPRTATSAPLTALAPAALGMLRAATCAAVVAPRADGLGAWQHRLPAGSPLVGPDPASGGGQYWLVLGGEGIVDARVLPRFGFVFAAPDDPAVTMTAGAAGLELLLLQFPHGKGT
jgi:hypothetical protein